jgi:hypothetical protein
VHKSYLINLSTSTGLKNMKAVYYPDQWGKGACFIQEKRGVAGDV